MKMSFQLMVDAGLPPPNAKPDGDKCFNNYTERTHRCYALSYC